MNILTLKLPALLAAAGLLIGSYLTHQYMGGKIAKIQNTHLQAEIDRRKLIQVNQDQLLDRVSIANNEVVASLYEQIGKLNDKSNVIYREVEKVIPVTDDCNISRGAVELLNTATRAANNNTAERVSETTRLTPSEAESASTIDQLTQAKYQLEVVRQCGEISSRYEALIEWIETTYPKPQPEGQDSSNE